MKKNSLKEALITDRSQLIGRRIYDIFQYEEEIEISQKREGDLVILTYMGAKPNEYVIEKYDATGKSPYRVLKHYKW